MVCFTVFGGKILAGASMGVENPTSTEFPNLGLSFQWPSGDIISTTDNDPRWDDLDMFPLNAARLDQDRKCLFWDNAMNKQKLRTRKLELAGRIIVVCEPV